MSWYQLDDPPVYASVEMALWDPTDRTLVAYATQLMFFAFAPAAT